MSETVNLADDGGILIYGDQIRQIPPGHVIRIEPLRRSNAGAPGRLVREVGTNRLWPSASALASEIGYARGSVYGHLQRRPGYATLGGRIYEYVK